MSSYRISISEIFAFAEQAGAALVEPCFHHGKLLSCGHDRFVGKSPEEVVRFGEIYNLDLLHEVAPTIRYEEYTKLSKANYKPTEIMEVCMTPKQNPDCQEKGSPNMCKKHASVYGLTAGHTVKVLRIGIYHRGCIHSVRSRRVLSHNLKFRTVHETFVDNTLIPLLNLKKGYHAFHWRSETMNNHGNQYNWCAQELIKSRTATGVSDDEQVLLITDIKSDPEITWGGVNNRQDKTHSVGTAHHAVALLRHFKFSVIDDVLEHPELLAAGAKRDLIFTAVWDVLLASRASHLQTCLNCRHNHVCHVCTWQGHFAELLRDMRKSYFPTGQKNLTDQCWVEPDHMPTCQRECLMTDCEEKKCSTCMFCESRFANVLLRFANATNETVVTMSKRKQTSQTPEEMDF
jgi:hypothetical protein